MNRRKKIKTILKKKNKRANAKKDSEVSPSKMKPRYVSKAERAAQEEEQKDIENNAESAAEITEAAPEEK